MKIAVIGSNGQLGTDLCKIINADNLIKLSHKDIEVTDYANSLRVLTDHSPNVVINTSAYNRVDDAEENFETALKVNCHAVKNLSLIANEIHAKLVHLTTDYVFDGQKRSPYAEEDAPNPVSAYGISKYCGEIVLRNYCRDWILIRTSGLFGTAGCSGKGGNFIETMIRLGKDGKKLRVVDDQMMSPTYTPDLAEKIYEIISKNLWGIFHVTNSEQCTWFELASEIFKMTKIQADLERTTSSLFGAKARRPAFSVLENARLKTAGIQPARSWKEALEDYLQHRA